MICALNFKKHRYLIVAIIILILCSLFINFVSGFCGAKTVFSERNITVNSYKDMQAFFSSFGWETGRLPVKIETILLPENCNESLLQYNEMQELAGLSVLNFCGKKVKKYTFAIKNHKSSLQSSVFGNLLVYGHRIIASDISLPDGSFSPINDKNH